MTGYGGESYQTPPPGVTPPSQFGPAPIGPGRESSAGKYLFIGCAVVALLAALLLGGTCLYMGKKGNDLIASMLEMGKPEYMKMLTPDHTPEQKDEFSQYYDMLGQNISEKGIIKFASEYGDVFQEFNLISQDKKITVQESQTWIEKFKKTLSQH
jgi:hypothetical protein